MKNIIKITFVVLIFATALPSCERAKVRHMVKKETQAKVVWLHEDSCYSVTRPLLAARYKASKSTRAWVDMAHDDLIHLSKQMDDRTIDHGGLKVRCWWVGYTYDGKNVDSTVVMVEPSGELLTETDELENWWDASNEITTEGNYVNTSHK